MTQFLWVLKPLQRAKLGPVLEGHDVLPEVALWNSVPSPREVRCQIEQRWANIKVVDSLICRDFQQCWYLEKIGPIPRLDFESSASANSATLAKCSRLVVYEIYLHVSIAVARSDTLYTHLMRSNSTFEIFLQIVSRIDLRCCLVTCW